MPDSANPIYRGYVVGSNVIDGKKLWKVRIDDPTAPRDKQLKPFRVQNTREGVELAASGRVRFSLALFGTGEQSEVRAVGVEYDPQAVADQGIHPNTGTDYNG